MVNSKFCEAIVKTSKLESRPRLCCSEDSCSSNPPRCPISSHSNLIHCRRIGDDLEACRRKDNASDKNAQEVCQNANSDKLFCLRVHDTKKNCETSDEYGVCDIPTSVKNLNSDAESEVKCLQCPDIFQEGGGSCDFYYPNGTKLPN
ncbi:6205_t:CDS:2 [Cetraspora pellucida]|uniref:6205_t:CDS:1 n=1 Tax=Cetraspora pellucida TaxID=1433469 RepID=A0ACA9KFN8_9GLOM|nr:6205_t:CDS:2 [Cetraspora pellucida]